MRKTNHMMVLRNVLFISFNYLLVNNFVIAHSYGVSAFIMLKSISKNFLMKFVARMSVVSEL